MVSLLHVSAGPCTRGRHSPLCSYSPAARVGTKTQDGSRIASLKYSRSSSSRANCRVRVRYETRPKRWSTATACVKTFSNITTAPPHIWVFSGSLRLRPILPEDPMGRHAWQKRCARDVRLDRPRAIQGIQYSSVACCRNWVYSETYNADAYGFRYRAALRGIGGPL
jgi:hypothetical protein